MGPISLLSFSVALAGTIQMIRKSRTNASQTNADAH